MQHATSGEAGRDTTVGASGQAVAVPTGWRRFLTTARLRSVSGLVLFAFVAMHLLNHALLLVSLRYAEESRALLAAPWRSLPGTALLYGAAGVHLVLTLLALYRRQTLSMRPVEFLRLVLGLLIPYFLIEHVVGTRLGYALYGELIGYREVVRSLWISSPTLGVQQTIALLVVWSHGCIGLSFLIRHREGWRPFVPVLLAAAVLLPVLSLLGFAMTGRWLALQNNFPGAAMSLYAPEIERMTRVTLPTAGDRARTLAATAAAIKIGYICLVAAILLARALRLFRARVQSISIRYSSGEVVRVLPGTSVLEASRAHGIAHYGICGGNARCSTCRVRVSGSTGPLPPRSPAEAATLARIQAGPDVRLACQLRPTHDLSVSLVLQPTAPQDAVILGRPMQAPREREIAVLFCDLRGFTKFSETRLPYDVVFLLNRYFVLVGEAVVGAGGRVDKFIGDGAMALFGFETGPDEACRGALAAADAILKAGAELNRQLKEEVGVSFDIAIGLHFGPAVIGVMGFGAALSETAIGDTVNVASRLETLAKTEGRMLAISEDVLIGAGITAEEAEVRPVKIRGRRKQIRVTLPSPERLSRLVAQHPVHAEHRG